MPKLQTRLAWFDRGAEAFAQTCPSVVRDVLPPHIGPVYICPLCVTPTLFRAFMRPAVGTNQLTAEHAPPEFAGGRAIALTCARWNHTAGSMLDSHASIAARYEDDPPGVLRDQRVRVALGQTQVNMTLEAGPTGMQLFGDENRNSPTAHAAFVAELNRLVESGDRDWNVKLQFREQYNSSHAAVSWLRAACIVAFAKFGYRFVLDPAYEVVRQKIDIRTSAPSLFGIRVSQQPKGRSSPGNYSGARNSGRWRCSSHGTPSRTSTWPKGFDVLRQGQRPRRKALGGSGRVPPLAPWTGILLRFLTASDSVMFGIVHGESARDHPPRNYQILASRWLEWRRTV